MSIPYGVFAQNDISFSITHIVLGESTTGSIDMNILSTFTNPPYSVEVTYPDGSDAHHNVQSSLPLSGLSAGTYCFTVVSADGCISQSCQEVMICFRTGHGGAGTIECLGGEDPPKGGNNVIIVLASLTEDDQPIGTPKTHVLRGKINTKDLPSANQLWNSRHFSKISKFDSSGYLQQLALGQGYNTAFLIEHNNDGDYVIFEHWRGQTTQDSDAQELAVYPNPSSGVYHLQSAFGFDEIKVFNTRGEIIVRKHLDNSTVNYAVDISDSGDGMYFIIVRTLHGWKSLKVVKAD